MIRFEPPTHHTVRRLCDLSVAVHQRDFVMAVDRSLALAPYEGGAHPFGIWDDDTPVGFLILLDMREVRTRTPEEDANAAYLWRLLIASGHQGRGYGRQALDFSSDWAREKGLPRLFTSAVDRNAAAIGLYEAFGFTRTGRVVHENEIELACDV